MSGIIPTNFVSTSILYIITLSSRGILHYRKKTINTTKSESWQKLRTSCFQGIHGMCDCIQEVSVLIECLVLFRRMLFRNCSSVVL